MTSPADVPSPRIPAGEPMIEAIGLSKHYGSFAAVQNVSFSVHRGELVAFLGPNGAGKSTTMKMLTGFLAPSEGSARIAGFDVQNSRLAASQRLGYLPENGPLYAEMSPHDLLSFFAEIRGLPANQVHGRIEEVIAICHLEDVVNKSIGKLSKGYRQRVGMAQALLHQPDVLILDEPTAGLDPNQIHDVRRTLQMLGREKTILLSTHILQEVAAIATRVVLIDQGRLRYDGSVDGLAEAGETLDDAFRRLTQGTPAVLV